MYKYMMGELLLILGGSEEERKQQKMRGFMSSVLFKK